MSKIRWQDATPLNTTLDRLLYDLRRTNDGLLLDSISIQDFIEASDGVISFDALVVTYNVLERRMKVLERLLNNNGSDTLKVSNIQISEPFKQRGTVNIAAVFELADGQNISIVFHNPDSDPGRIMPTDELVSYQWRLNKRDITVTVAPEQGKDLDVRTVAKRIMALAEKNSAAFAKANTKKTERLQRIEGLKSEIATLETELTAAQKRLEVARIDAEMPKPEPEEEPAVLEENENVLEENDPNAVTVTGEDEVGKALNESGVTTETEETTEPQAEDEQSSETETAAAEEEAGAETAIMDWHIAVRRDLSESGWAGFDEGNEMTITHHGLNYKLVTPDEATDSSLFDLFYDDGNTWVNIDTFSYSEDRSANDVAIDIIDSVNGHSKHIKEQQPADKIAKVNAAYQFDNASDEFKEWIADSVDKDSYSKFVTARDMDMRAKNYRDTHIEWGFFNGFAVDSAIDGSEELTGEIPLDDNLDPIKEGLEAEITLDSGKTQEEYEKADPESKQDNPDKPSDDSDDEESPDDELEESDSEETESEESDEETTDSEDDEKEDDANCDSSTEETDPIQARKAVFDAVVEDSEDIQYVGKVIKGGELIGRVDFGGDGKAMVYVGASGDSRVQYNGRDVYYSDDDAADMIDWLFGMIEPSEEDVKEIEETADPAPVEEAVAEETPVPDETVQDEEMDNSPVKNELQDRFGWSVRDEFMTKVIADDDGYETRFVAGWEPETDEWVIETSNGEVGRIKDEGETSTLAQDINDVAHNFIVNVNALLLEKYHAKGGIDTELESLKSETDIATFDKRLDDLAAKVEAAGLMEEYEPKLNEVADILTGLLAEAEKAA